MSRAKATRHCRECTYHFQARKTEPHYCRADHWARVPYNPSRTSPEWCPVGHLIPGVPYPTFSPGADPWTSSIARIVEKSPDFVENSRSERAALAP